MIVIVNYYKTDLTLPIMILLSGIALTLGFPPENMHENRLLVVDIKDSQIPKEYPSCPLCWSWNTRRRNKTRRYLEPIIIKLKNVNGKFEENKKQLEKFYQGYSLLTLPNDQLPKGFGCLNFRLLEKKISELEKEFRKIKKNLKSLIALEKSPGLKKHDSNKGRLKLLQEFLAEVKNILVELRHKKNAKNKRRNLSHIKSQTKLKIEEWKILKKLEKVSKNYLDNFRNLFECL